jgi:hypothetical protein
MVGVHREDFTEHLFPKDLAAFAGEKPGFHRKSQNHENGQIRQVFGRAFTVNP